MPIRLERKPPRGWSDEQPQVCNGSIGCVRVPRIFWGGARRQGPGWSMPTVLILMGDWCGSIRHRESEDQGAK